MELNEFRYTLPDERVARYPLAQRDRSKLLVFKGGEIRHHTFTELPDLLPDHTFLFLNNTRVIPARMLFSKETGASIEIFLLDPVRPSPVIAEAMVARRTTTWHCTIGNIKRWKEGKLYMSIGDLSLAASLENREKGIVTFEWNEALPFAEVIRRAGKTPLPPYLNRAPEKSDEQNYQTIYARADGAVAAPTAGLHFTDDVFRRLGEKGILHDYLTLHVSAGTFLPIKTDDVTQHVMHREQILVTRQNILNLLKARSHTTAVGTTSMRTIESLYWYGARLIQDAATEFHIGQDDAYAMQQDVDPTEALNAILKKMEIEKSEMLLGETSIFIRPGYRFRLCNGLITNFHQPESTLILLVAAFVGNDWKKIYQEALEKGYRFLSYGDSSLLVP